MAAEVKQLIIVEGLWSPLSYKQPILIHMLLIRHLQFSRALFLKRPRLRLSGDKFSPVITASRRKRAAFDLQLPERRPRRTFHAFGEEAGAPFSVVSLGRRRSQSAQGHRFRKTKPALSIIIEYQTDCWDSSSLLVFSKKPADLFLIGCLPLPKSI